MRKTGIHFFASRSNIRNRRRKRADHRDHNPNARNVAAVAADKRKAVVAARY
jgi:hypothetical protein